MKAAVSARYGPPEVVEVREVPTPQPAANELLVEIHFTTVSRTDCGMRKAHPFFIRPMSGWLRPKNPILGMDFAGTVEAVGTAVSRFAPGDRVFGMSPERFGGHAEFLCVSETGAVAHLPDGVPLGEAVVCEGAWYAHSTTRAVKPGQDVLIYGASGAIGTAAVQLAKARGANVTAVVGTQHLELADQLGADRVIDYTAVDFTAIGETFDLVFDSVGKTSFFLCRRLLKPNGIFSATDLGPWWSNIWLSFWFGITGSRRVTIPMPVDAPAFVQSLAELMARGSFRGVFDRTYQLDQIVEAYRYVETGRKTGIVTVAVV